MRHMNADVSANDAVAIVATMDTKRAEVLFLSNVIEGAGRKVLLVDVGTSGSSSKRSRDPASLLRSIAQNTRIVVREMYEAGKISAIVGVAGGKGSGLFGEIVSDLPYGFPKLLVSSARPALLAELAKTNDILLYPTLVDLFGVNGFTARILTNAGQAIAGMRYSSNKDARRSVVAISAFGVTTPAVDQCVRLLSDQDIEAIVFPANGAGGRKMEALIEDGEFDAVIDLTTTELADELLEGTASAGSERLKAAGRRGIPQLIAPGAVDMVNFGPRDTVPQKYSGRNLYRHTQFTTLMRTNAEENERIGRIAADRLAGAKGPTAVLFPLHGVSDYDREGGVFFDREADVAWLKGLRSGLPTQVEVSELQCHINDPAFADTAVGWIVNRLREERPE